MQIVDVCTNQKIVYRWYKVQTIHDTSSTRYRQYRIRKVQAKDRKGTGMHRIIKKLKNNSGASMVMALLLMLVGVMTSAVVTAAAINAAISVKEERAEQQAYLTVSSAATLIKDDMEAGKCDYKEVLTEVYDWDYWNWGWSSTPSSSTSTIGAGDSIFSSIIKDGLQKVRANSGYVFNEKYTINAADNADVSIEIFISEDTNTDTGDVKYNITVNFEGGEDHNNCRMCLTAQGESSTGEPNTGESGSRWDRTKTVTTTTTVSWKNVKLKKEAK